MLISRVVIKIRSMNHCYVISIDPQHFEIDIHRRVYKLNVHLSSNRNSALFAWHNRWYSQAAIYAYIVIFTTASLQRLPNAVCKRSVDRHQTSVYIRATLKTTAADCVERPSDDYFVFSSLCSKPLGETRMLQCEWTSVSSWCRISGSWNYRLNSKSYSLGLDSSSSKWIRINNRIMYVVKIVT